MKKIIVLIICTSILCSCNRYPLEIKLSTFIFIDEATKSDTIIIQYNDQYNDLSPQIYYAKKNWQTSPNPSLQHMLINIKYRTQDSISIGIPASATNSFYNYRFEFLDHGSRLESQNLLEMPPISNAVIFKKLE